jgi:hypothetical protein
MTQSTNVRCSINDRAGDVTPTTSTVLEDDVSGVRPAADGGGVELTPPPAARPAPVAR